MSGFPPEIRLSVRSVGAASPGAAIEFRLPMAASCFAQSRTDSTDAPSVESQRLSRLHSPEESVVIVDAVHYILANLARMTFLVQKNAQRV